METSFPYTEYLQIPSERIPILLGRLGLVKKKIEQQTGIRLKVGETVEITGQPEGVFLASTIVKAIARGFDPDQAFLLADEEWELSVITLGHETRNTQKRLFGRVIGRSGQAKKNIEESCKCRIAVYGKTVSVISHTLDHKRATQAVELLLEGHTHPYVYKRVGGRAPL